MGSGCRGSQSQHQRKDCRRNRDTLTNRNHHRTFLSSRIVSLRFRACGEVLKERGVTVIMDFLTMLAYGLGYTLFMPIVLPIAWPHLSRGGQIIWVLLLVAVYWFVAVGERAQHHGWFPVGALVVWILGPLLVFGCRRIFRSVFRREA